MAQAQARTETMKRTLCGEWGVRSCVGIGGGGLLDGVLTGCSSVSVR